MTDFNVQAAKDVQVRHQNDRAYGIRSHNSETQPVKDEDKGGKLLARPAKGSKKQLIGTIVGIAAVVILVAVLCLWNAR